MRARLVLTAMLCVLPAALAAAPAPDQALTCANGPLARRLQIQNGALRTVEFDDAARGVRLKVKAEPFRLVLGDKSVVSGAAFRVTRVERSDAGLTIDLALPARGMDARLAFRPGPTPGTLRKAVSLRASGKPFVLRDIDVECLAASMPVDLGGRGQPLYLWPEEATPAWRTQTDKSGARPQPTDAAFFLGLEFPAGFNMVERGRLVLRHRPGKTIGREWWTSKSALLGAGGHNEFMRYVAAIRRPPRSYLLYNSWYDLRGSEMTVERLAATYEEFRKHLSKYGVKLDAIVPDDGWQNRDSIWEPNRKMLPHGYRPLADILEKGGTHLGLWMPLTGVNLHVAWGAARGYEAASARHYCLSAPHYNKKIREVLRDKILGWHVAYFKHDFNSFTCSKPGHGHLPEAAYGFEANVDAELKLLQYERSLRPDIFLNVTSSMWLSPWWLTEADAIWMGCGDFGLIKTVPALERRDWAITYRDHHLWRRFVKERVQYPMTATMTHGVIYGRRNLLGGRNEPLDKWSDNVVWYFLRGMQMKELYVTPSLLTDAQWDVLGRACRWATDHAAVLREAHMILGDPGKGEVYGFAAHAGGKAFFGFRNPSLEPQDVSISGRELIGDQPMRLRLIYPFKCDAGTLRPQDRVTQSLGPNEIRIYRGDAAPDVTKTQLADAAFGPGPSPLRVVLSRSPAAGGLEAKVSLRRDDVKRIELALVLRNIYDVDAARAITVRCNGRPVQCARVRLDGLQILHAALPVKPMTLTVQLTASQFDRPFQEAVQLAGWLLADYTGPAGPAPAGPGELACPYATRRRTAAALCPPAFIRARRARRAALTPADLKDVRAAKLHLLVFGSEGGKYGGKPIWLNGVEVAKVPTCPRPPDRWRRFVLSIPKDKLSLLRVKNTIQLGNRGGDCYKVRALALAVQLKDGTWVETRPDPKTYCSVRGWKYGEGARFQSDRSPKVSLQFEEGAR